MLTTTTGGGSGLISAADLPGAGIDLDAVSGYAKTLAAAGVGIETGGTDAAAAWSRLPTAYESTGTEALYSALVPVTEHGSVVNTALGAAQKALDNYVSQARSVLAKVASLRSDVTDFASSAATSYPKPVPFALDYAPPPSRPNALSAPKPTYDSWEDDPAAVAANDELAARARALSNDLLNLQSECAAAIRRAAGLPAYGAEQGAEDALASRSRAGAPGHPGAGAAPEGGIGSLFRSIGDWVGDVAGGVASGVGGFVTEQNKVRDLENAAIAQGWADAGKWWNDTAVPALGVAGKAALQWGDDALANTAAVAQSWARAVQEHPDEFAEAAEGAILLGLAGSMEGIGAGLDATGVGVIGGIPLAIAGAAVAAGGAAALSDGLGNLADHAMSDDRVDPTYRQLFNKEGGDTAGTAGSRSGGASRAKTGDSTGGDPPVKRTFNGNVPMRDLSPEEEAKYSRPSGYRKGVRDGVYDNAQEDDGLVRDPGKERQVIGPDDKWDMGHLPRSEFRKFQVWAADNNLTRKEFLDEYNRMEHYRPELRPTNRSHELEDKSDAFNW